MTEVMTAMGCAALIGAFYGIVHLLYLRERGSRGEECRSEAGTCGHCGCCRFSTDPGKPAGEGRPAEPENLQRKHV